MGLFSTRSDATTGGKSVAWWSRQPTTTVDPRTLHLARTPVDRAAVGAYKRNPRRHSSDGDPCLVITASGRRELRNGKHRAIAAIETGRKLRVRVVDERKRS